MTVGWEFSQVLHYMYIINGDPSKEIKLVFDSVIFLHP